MTVPTDGAPVAASTTTNVPVSTVPTTLPQVQFVQVPAATPAGKYSDEDLNRVRQQEKDKLYGEIERLKNENKSLADQAKAVADAEAAARAEAAEAARKAAEASGDIASIQEQMRAEFEARLAEEKAQREAALALLNREREFSELEAYRQQAVAAAQDDIIPDLLPMISGNTQEEIDASIARLKETSASILEGVSAAAQAQRQQMPGTRVTAPAAGPLETNPDNQTFSPEQIANMSFTDYVKNRTRLLGQAAQNRSGGLFG